jgi:hypothetical protein
MATVPGAITSMLHRRRTRNTFVEFTSRVGERQNAEIYSQPLVVDDHEIT